MKVKVYTPVNAPVEEVQLRLRPSTTNSITLVEVSSDGKEISMGRICTISERGITLHRGYAGNLPTQSGGFVTYTKD